MGPLVYTAHADNVGNAPLCQVSCDIGSKSTPQPCLRKSLAARSGWAAAVPQGYTVATDVSLIRPHG
jgi:hypothetical protein